MASSFPMPFWNLAATVSSPKEGTAERAASVEWYDLQWTETMSATATLAGSVVARAGIARSPPNPTRRRPCRLIASTCSFQMSTSVTFSPPSLRIPPNRHPMALDPRITTCFGLLRSVIVLSQACPGLHGVGAIEDR